MKERSLSFETLRIICTLMIIAFHYVFHGGAGLYDNAQMNCFTSEIIYHLGELGVNCFILISGYFMIETAFKPRKVVLLIFQIEFYVLLSKVILVLYGENTSWELVQFFPMLLDRYWFIHAYLLLYLMMPFLKRMLSNLNQKELLALIGIQVFIWSAIPSLILVSLFGYTNTESMPFYNRYIWLLVMYAIGSYVRRYGLPELKRDILHIHESKPWMVIILPYELMILFILLGERGLWPYTAVFFRTPNSILMLAMSLALFYPFINLKVHGRYAKCIQMLSTCSLGIYLFHDGEIRQLLWQKLFPYIATENWFCYIGQVLLVTGVVYSVGVLIEKLRQSVERVVLYPIIDKTESLLSRLEIDI